MQEIMPPSPDEPRHATTDPAAGERPALLGGAPLSAEPIRLTEPTLPPLADLLPDLEATWARRQLTNHGPFSLELARQLGLRLGVGVVPAASGTAGLMATLRALGVRGEVVVPAITFSATAHAVVWAGATPAFADVDPHTWCLTPESIAPRLTGRTEAILAVHLFGPPCDADALDAFARRRGLALVLDAAQAFGSVYPDGRPVGSGGLAEVFSFHATKLLPAGEGGAIATADATLAARVALVLRFGESGGGEAARVGLNGKMTEWAAILALHGLPEVSARIARRAALVDRAWRRLAELPGLTRQTMVPGARTNHQMLPLAVDEGAFGLPTGRLAEALAAEGIDVRRHYFPPLHRHPAFAAADAPSLPAADALAARLLCLPLSSHMEERAVDLVAAAVERCHRWRDALRVA